MENVPIVMSDVTWDNFWDFSSFYTYYFQVPFRWTAAPCHSTPTRAVRFLTWTVICTLADFQSLARTSFFLRRCGRRCWTTVMWAACATSSLTERAVMSAAWLRSRALRGSAASVPGNSRRGAAARHVETEDSARRAGTDISATAQAPDTWAATAR